MLQPACEEYVLQVRALKQRPAFQAGAVNGPDRNHTRRRVKTMVVTCCAGPKCTASVDEF